MVKKSENIEEFERLSVRSFCVDLGKRAQEKTLVEVWIESRL